MSHLPRFLIDGFVYHTISTTRGRIPLFADRLNALTVLETIEAARVRREAYILAFAVMPDHLHLLVSPIVPNELPGIIQGIKSVSSHRINSRMGSRGPRWQQSYYDRAIRNELQLFQTIDYIHRNPVEAHLSATAEEFEFSSAYPPSRSDVNAFFGLSE
jgi:REP element-mobilizing transposase RayT